MARSRTARRTASVRGHINAAYPLIRGLPIVVNQPRRLHCSRELTKVGTGLIDVTARRQTGTEMKTARAVIWFRISRPGDHAAARNQERNPPDRRFGPPSVTGSVWSICAVRIITALSEKTWYLPCRSPSTCEALTSRLDSDFSRSSESTHTPPPARLPARASAQPPLTSSDTKPLFRRKFPWMAIAHETKNRA
jgi:hypothetical protein